MKPVDPSELSDSKRRLLEQRLRGAAKAEPRDPGAQLPSGRRPASPAEEWLFLAHRAQTPAPVFNRISSYRVSGQLDLPSLGRSVGTLIARHETLRSAFTLIDGQVQVTVRDDVETPVEIIACRDGREQRSRAETFARRPFDAARAPLIRW